MYFAYAIKNSLNEKIYIGQTNDIKTRLLRHNGILKNKNTSYTSKNKGEWKLVYNEKFETRKEAMDREKQLKSFRGREFIRNKIKELEK
ncbi:MAG TPA: endonuclease [Candidatus Moranbacteria bacterium]|nr:endonuclease [Candidatus Moranbacteria bacterium]HBT45638.1 endonuclease [Candidatus Moranbacteria bacterium]